MTCQICGHSKEGVCGMFKKRTLPENYCTVHGEDSETFKLMTDRAFSWGGGPDELQGSEESEEEKEEKEVYL